MLNTSVSILNYAHNVQHTDEFVHTTQAYCKSWTNPIYLIMRYHAHFTPNVDSSNCALLLM